MRIIKAIIMQYIIIAYYCKFVKGEIKNFPYYFISVSIHTKNLSK